MVEDFGWGDETSDNDEEDVLIQFWEANRRSNTTDEDGRKYWELTTHKKLFYILNDVIQEDDDDYDYRLRLSSYRTQSICCTITIQDDDYEDKVLENDPQQIVISRVFRNKISEWNTLKNKYPHNGFAISCGIRSCLYIPVYNTAGDYYSGSNPCGVMEYVSTCEKYLEKIRKYLGLTWLPQRKMYINGDHLYGFGRLKILEHVILEMDQLLTLVCQKFPLPLAQYWVTVHPHTEPLRVMYQKSHTEMKNLKFLDKFKQACMEMRLNKDEGLVGYAYRTGKTFFCNDIKELSITNQHLGQYASCNLSIASFVICLYKSFGRKCVLEFFLPPQEMITYNPQNFLNSLLATMNDYLPHYMIASGEQLGPVLMVEVIDSSMHNKTQFLKLGEWKNSFPHHEYEGLPSLEASHLSKILFGQDEHIVVNTSSTTNSCNETATGETLERDHARDSVAEIIHLDKLEEESSIKCIEPQSLTSKSNRSKEDLINEANTEKIYQSAPETTLEVAIKHKDHTVAADTVDELVEEPPFVDIGHNMDVRYTMNYASQISNFEPMISFPQQVEEETMVLDTLAQNSRNILVTENDDISFEVAVVNKTCQEVHTSKRKIKPQKDISFESLREHFGKPLDEVAASYGVSRSTMKRKIRVHDIKRWPNGKRRRSNTISSNLKRKLNDEEPSRRNFSRLGLPSSQDKVVAHTSQHLNKMTIKATYNRVTIRFELSDLSGIAELEDNVIERLHLEKKSFSIQYQDDEDDWILIACDKDVQECMEISRSLKKTTIKMSIDAPIINHDGP